MQRIQRHFQTEQRYECNRAGLVLLAYLCGSISSAILVCRLAGLPDPRDSGSGNPGPLTYYELAEKGGRSGTYFDAEGHAPGGAPGAYAVLAGVSGDCRLRGPYLASFISAAVKASPRPSALSPPSGSI